MIKGKLYLIPAIISDDTHHTVVPEQVKSVLPSIKHFAVENVRTARRFLSSLKIYDSIQELNFEVLDKDTPTQEIKRILQPLFDGLDLGVLSEAGCPGVADPGALAVAFAHDHNIQVVPLVGPSSILLALMASGLNGQKFAFHGYLPVDQQSCTHAIRSLEKESKQKNQTQIVIETPYRNNYIRQLLIQTLHPDTRLSIAIDLTGQQEQVITRKVGDWKRGIKETHDLPKLPAVFSFLAM